MNREKKVYIIILNWNGTDDTIECLKSVLSLEKVNYQIILVDNYSEEDSFLELKKWCLDTYSYVGEYEQSIAEQGGSVDVENELKNYNFKDQILLIKNSDNLGFAAGNNVALRYLRSKNKGENYTLLLNNDTIVEPDFLAHLVSFMQSNEEYVACTPQIRLFEPSNKIWNCGGSLLWIGNRRYYYAGESIDKVPQQGVRDVSYITGCALFFQPERTGILSDKFFFGEEDMDFSLRQKKAGHKMACVFQSIIYHKVHASVGRITGEINLGKVYLFYLMRFIDNRQYAPKWLYSLQVIINVLYAIPMIRIRYKASFYQIFRLFKALLHELKTADSVDKTRCLELLNTSII